MPEDKGYYQKYKVTRTDGKPVGRTFTIEVDRDPFAVKTLKAYRDQAALAGFKKLEAGLSQLIAEIETAP